MKVFLPNNCADMQVWDTSGADSSAEHSGLSGAPCPSSSTATASEVAAPPCGGAVDFGAVDFCGGHGGGGGGAFTPGTRTRTCSGGTGAQSPLGSGTGRGLSPVEGFDPSMEGSPGPAGYYPGAFDGPPSPFVPSRSWADPPQGASSDPLGRLGGMEVKAESFGAGGGEEPPLQTFSGFDSDRDLGLFWGVNARMDDWVQGQATSVAGGVDRGGPAGGGDEGTSAPRARPTDDGAAWGFSGLFDDPPPGAQAARLPRP